MVERTRIVIPYSYQEYWIGGTYYLENLISALNALDDPAQPELVIFTSAQSYQTLLSRIQYPHLSFWSDEKLPRVARGANKALAILGLGPAFRKKPMVADFVFPATWDPVFRRVRNRIFWIPDYQEHFMPEMFSDGEVAGRKAHQKQVIASGRNLVFSSASAQADFQTIYPHSGLRQFVLPFAVTLPRGVRPGAAELEKLYNLPQRYFICCNQFWKHKNHPTLFRAIAEIRKEDPGLVFCLTGSQTDTRHPDYFSELRELVDSLGIRDQLRFLGFIPRDHQLGLIENSLAVIQPSLFEGWSTVVEDGKALNHPIIASDLLVHREQLAKYPACRYFASGSGQELASAILEECRSPSVNAEVYDYQEDIRAYASNFLQMLDAIDPGSAS